MARRKLVWEVNNTVYDQRSAVRTRFVKNGETFAFFIFTILYVVSFDGTQENTEIQKHTHTSVPTQPQQTKALKSSTSFTYICLLTYIFCAEWRWHRESLNVRQPHALPCHRVWLEHVENVKKKIPCTVLTKVDMCALDHTSEPCGWSTITPTVVYQTPIQPTKITSNITNIFTQFLDIIFRHLRCSKLARPFV